MKTARTKTTLDALLDRWLAQHEVDPTTRMNYESQIRNYIQPNLGDVPLPLFVLQASERLETSMHDSAGADASAMGSRSLKSTWRVLTTAIRLAAAPHVCKPYAASSVDRFTRFSVAR